MPELPEVETVVRGLAGRILSRRIVEARVLDARMLRSDPVAFVAAVSDRRVAAIRRHGKAVFIRLDHAEKPANVLLVHLGMTGQLVFEAAAAPLAKHTHLVFRFEGMKEDLRYRDARRFGRIKILDAETALSTPDAWLATDAEIFAALRRRTGMLKHVLLNQGVIAGLGNIYVDESLHLARLHPKKNLSSVTDARLHELCAAIRAVLGASLKLGGTSFRNYVDTQGGRGGFKGRLRVYGKQGTPCLVCGQTIRRVVVATRGTHFCPTCQPAPRRSRV